MNRLVRMSSLVQRRTVLPQCSRVPFMRRNVDDKIREREMALEDDYVRRYEKERVEVEKSKNEKPKLKKQHKNKKRDSVLLNQKVDKYPGRLSDSGIIF
ncbi:hypothetical protein DICPUDRAFT_152364 [Dictyostelium purpureum]|uniref:Uncharacterized protein n=1 Tax=Dictyostelium purpureum TaxID=5786 RepID=F0ZL60_DICPU|nr:uncharacterized protein DICPUDRAFT_152364 [Dictyostelium purpureum]EGC35337.1 hypothetical protein DICPUDRAFT_152364 [Dictyostelium purpureum]|eukprot:XP_003288144.1 hypothetical protein DICPUDRAFT_152364 [Dictyostelium purpureum]